MSDRKEFLGATDIAPLLGWSPHKTPYELWLEKTGRAEPKPPSLWMELGTVLQPKVLELATTQIGAIQPGGEWAIASTPIRCHPDGVTSQTQPVEAKTVWAPVREGWGEGPEDIPWPYLVQCAIQLEATKAEICYVPVLFVSAQEFRMYQVQAYSPLQQYLVDQACAWWDKYVVKDTPPPMTTLPAPEVLKRVRREPNKVVEWTTTELWDRYELAKALHKETAELVRSAEAVVLWALGNAEAAKLPDGRLVTYYEQHRRSYVVPESTYRVLRVKGGQT